MLQTLTRPPYTIGYNGALFREYPGPWQVMFKQDSGVYACVAERRERYNLGEFKDELQEQLGLNTDEKGSLQEFLRRGYRVRPSAILLSCPRFASCASCKSLTWNETVRSLTVYNAWHAPLKMIS